MSESRDLSTVAASLAALKPFPKVVALVRTLAADPYSSASDVARAVEGDVGVAADVLRVANAPASGLAQRCTSLRHAVSMLGTRRVSEVVASAAALAFVEGYAALDGDLSAHAVAVAGIARLLAPIVAVSPDEAFTLGLLHDVGAMLIVQSDDPFYEGLVEHTASGGEPCVDDERALMGFDHGALGAEVLRNWLLPEPLPQVVEIHHRWADALAAGGTVAAQVALARVAEALIPVVSAIAEPRLDDLAPLLEEPAFGHIGLSEKELVTLWPALRRACDKAFVVADDDEAMESLPGDARAGAAPAANAHVSDARTSTTALIGLLAVAAIVATALIGLLLET